MDKIFHDPKFVILLPLEQGLCPEMSLLAARLSDAEGSWLLPKSQVSACFLSTVCYADCATDGLPL